MTATLYMFSTADATLTGAVNGVNTVFTPNHTVVASSVIAWINTIPTGFTVVSGAVHLASAPLTGDTVYVRGSSEEEASTGSGVSAQTIIQDALTEIGILPQGATAGTNDLAWGLAKLNDLLDSWNVDDLFTYYTDDVQHSIITFAASYTIGPSAADIIAARPKKIISANWIGSSGLRMPIGIMDVSEYGEISDPTSSAETPVNLYYKPTFPNGTIYLRPYPTVAGILELFTESLLSSFAALSTVYALPLGYKRALTLSLAEDLCGSFTVQAPAKLELQAHMARMKIRSNNMTTVKVESDLPGTAGGYFDPLTRTWR